MELTRKQVIDDLSYIADSMPDDVCGDWRDSLAYAISSLKTDEAYQIMYEGGEIFTKDEVIDMITGIINEIDEEAWKQGCNSNYDREDEAYYISNLIQQKIDALEE